MEQTNYLCPRCLAILGDWINRGDDGVCFCRVCKTRFVSPPPTSGHEVPEYDVYQYLTHWGYRYDFIDVDAHKAKLTEAAQPLLDERAPWHRPPVDSLLKVLAKATNHVHFMTWGISPELLGALKLIRSTGIRVSGLVTNARDYLIQDLADNPREAGLLQIIPFPQSESWDKPHVKLIEVDGLIAFSGSANLTMTAWRKAITGGEMITVVTDEAEVVRLHNRYFSSNWIKYNKRGVDTGKDYVMRDL